MYVYEHITVYNSDSLPFLLQVFSVLEIFDKLCASFGQDILEALFASATSARHGSRYAMCLDLLIAYGYLMVHTLVSDSYPSNLESTEGVSEFWNSA